MSTTQRRLAYAAATVATTGAASTLAYREVDRQRRPLQGCSAVSLDAALPTLQASGVAVVGEVVDQHLLDRIKATAVYESMPTFYQRPSGGAMSRRRGPPAPQQPMDLWPTSAKGRYHRREESFNDEDLKVFEQLEQKIWPLVEAFFQEGNKAIDSQGGQDAKKRLKMDQIFRSELQVHAIGFPG